MKKIVIMLVAVASLNTSFARDISEKKNLFGILGGVDMTTMTLDKSADDAKNNVKAGGRGGFTFERRLGKSNIAALETGVFYVNKGAQQKYSDSFLGVDYSIVHKLNFHSIEVPLIAKFYIGKKKIFNVNVGGFASYAFNVQSKATLTNKSNGEKNTETDNNLLKDQIKDGDGDVLYRPFDAGINAGFEFISRMGLGAGAKFSQGFVDFTNPKFTGSDDKKVYHTGLSFYMLFKF